MTEKKPEYSNYQLQHNETYLPEQYKGYTDSFYEKDDSSASSFLIGAIVGGVVGAATALFLAPKTGKEMREGFSTQAVQLKDKSIEISTVAKGKADEMAKTIQEQSGQIVEKVKTMTSKTMVPLDDGTVSSEGEEAIEFIENIKDKAEDVKEAVEEKIEEIKES